MFKTFFIRTFLLVSVFFIFHGNALAIEDRGAFFITKFDVGIFVKKNAIIEVEEAIDVTFSEERHGIFRKIPVKYTDENGFKYKMRMRNVSVSDGAGHNFEFTKYNEGNDIVLKIGNPDTEVIGPVRYVIRYEIQRGVRFFDDHNEIYWNPIGNGWSTTIENASSTVHFEESLIFPKESLICFTGEFGSRERDCSIRIISDRDVKFSATKLLKEFEGLTIAINIPKGMIDEPSRWEYFISFLVDNWAFIIPIIVLGAMFYIWKYKGKELELKRTIISQYGPPDNLTPGELGFLLKEEYKNNFISADIVNLAVKGYLEIREIGVNGLSAEMAKIVKKISSKKTVFFRTFFVIVVIGLVVLFLVKKVFIINPGSSFFGAFIFLVVFLVILFLNLKNFKGRFLLNGIFDYELENKKDWRNAEELTNHEKVLMEGLFDDNVLGKVKLSKKRNFYQDVNIATKKVEAQIDAKGYFEKSIYNNKSLYIVIGIVSGFGMFFVGAFYQRLDFFISAILVALILIGFGVLMSRKTKKGAEAYWHAIGYQYYIDIAENHRARFYEEENIFEKTLPYAMVFGNVDKWAKAFEGLIKKPPNWYRSDSTNTYFAPAIFASSLNQSFSAVTKSISSPPNSSSSGFSGGSSGGGGGGGGGGSW